MARARHESQGPDVGWSDFQDFQRGAAARRPRRLPRRGRSRRACAHLDGRPARVNFAFIARPSRRTKPVLLATATEPDYLDIGAEYGKTYQYSVQARARQHREQVVGPGSDHAERYFPAARSHRADGIDRDRRRGTGLEPQHRSRISRSIACLRSEEGGPFARSRGDWKLPFIPITSSKAESTTATRFLRWIRMETPARRALPWR